VTLPLSHSWLLVSEARLEPICLLSALQEFAWDFYTRVKDTVWLQVLQLLENIACKKNH
jgi:hypothetical protein